MILPNVKKIDSDWLEVKNMCRTTVNKEASNIEPTSEFKLKLLISEHSPIRLIKVHWKWDEIKSWVATHFSRHWLGFDKWISTCRSDRTGVDRSTLTQDQAVAMEVCANAQALINVSRYRLCNQASRETLEHMAGVKSALKESEPELYEVMVPNCVYRCGCPEFKSCNLINTVKTACELQHVDVCNIKERYSVYNKLFEGRFNNGN